jgi:transglutaminase-like putative cysteine protease
MVTMLRSQGIPARVAVGYSTGQQVTEDTWVVRGTNAHAWVEVYFPGYGWETFDPTPQAALRERQIAELENTRQIAQEFNDPEGVTFDTRQSWNVPAEGISSGENETDVTADAGIEEYNLSGGGDPLREGSSVEAANTSEESAVDGGNADPISSIPGPRAIVVLVLVFGSIAVGGRSLYGQRIAARIRVHYLPHRDPETQLERSFDRLFIVLEHRYRGREQGETVREYLSDIEPDPRAHRVAAIRERARYRGDATEELAAEAVRLVDALARDT